jgi:hypothetical protein
MFFVVQPDMAHMEDEGISDEISRLEAKSQGQVFDSIAKCFTSCSFLYFVHLQLPSSHG